MIFTRHVRNGECQIAEKLYKRTVVCFAFTDWSITVFQKPLEIASRTRLKMNLGCLCREEQNKDEKLLDRQTDTR